MADRRLQVFTTVAQLLSFTKAAETLHMTQPAVTFQIRQLEEYFNTRLFDRAHNRITLTTAGKLVKSYGDRIISEYREMDNEIRKLTGDVLGPLVIGASTTIGEYVIPGVLGEYQARFPQVTVRLYVANTMGVIHMVESNEIDIGIVEGPVGNKNLVTEVCWTDELVLVTPPEHPLAGDTTVEPQKIMDYPFISREEGSGTREVISNYLRNHELAFSAIDLAMEFGSPESIKRAVAAGLGISVLSVATLDKELSLNLLAKTSLNPALTRPFSIVYQRQKFRLRAMEEFLLFIQEHCERISSES
ncbi:MAG: LysR family transcriptional regulator [Proteobacteria bacterium]|jgi:DNA-binding transcriptional LysR family regulator|nr:LysR family transcriptional regulator [Pseudomonadota bacterium]MBP09681.1 LysR family transcriptional regulator [Acidiferrobacteraceae bacterium]MDP6134899.1 LysR family transcriptional regulator [Arenicellales bacterium]HCF74146.1 LysR family transcriptional regulator [Gammaproteobacteria bacterium]MDP7220671.1 LysR family transcriptional regulator [Arenicellales bacterium]|tara:strand:- start:5252 stop:6160 length:909 start_codon:yes stop_codon:yes gene_type:complete